MKFSIYGVIDDEEVRITWNNGSVDGDRVAVDELIALAKVLEGTAVGPEPDGPFTHRNHLSDPLSTMLLVEDVMDDILRRVGELPQTMWAEERRVA